MRQCLRLYDVSVLEDNVKTIRQTIIRERYSVTAPSYDELYRSEQYAKYASVVWKKPPRGKILDDGCGTGLLLEYIALHRLHGLITYYICLDLTREMLVLAKRRVQDLNLSHLVDFVESDAEYLPLRSRSVNTVYSFTVFDLLENFDRGVEEAVRVSQGVVVYSILKSIPRLYIRLIGRYLAETDKDIIFYVEPS